MKAVQVLEAGKAEFLNVPKPEWQPGHALIRPLKLSLCGSDIRMLYHAAPDEYPFAPGTTGHEMVGEIEQIDDHPFLRKGDHVLALAPDHRAMAEYYLAPLEHVLPIPGRLPLDQMLQAQQLGTVIYASQRLPNIGSKTVAVIGQGSAGLWFDFHLRRMGARKVIAFDLEQFRLDHARRFGATDVVDNSSCDAQQALLKINDGELADVVIEAAGEIDSINLAVHLVKKYGDVLYFGYPRGQYFSFAFEEFFHKCCKATTIVGATCETNQTSTRIALDVIASGEIDVTPILTHQIPFREVFDAYELHRTREDQAVKILVDMQ
ncbi:MAG: zinc-binding dehydrogenase [Pirellulaceae bacterium]|nr:zinc-binding dehydrogenase [Pirellulaceae bacterium]